MKHADTQPQLFLDCDGVLADFEHAAQAVFGQTSHEAQAQLGARDFWHTLREQPNFYGNLPLLPDARTLFNAVAHLHPVILTGCPSANGPSRRSRAGPPNTSPAPA